MGMTWGRWRTRTVAAGLIGGVAYVLVLLAGDLWAAEIASHDPPCFPSVSFSCFMPPSFFDVVGVHVTSFVVGLIAIVAVHEVADRRVVRTPSGIERVLLATLLTVLFLPGLVAMAATAPRPRAHRPRPGGSARRVHVGVPLGSTAGAGVVRRAPSVPRRVPHPSAADPGRPRRRVAPPPVRAIPAGVPAPAARRPPGPLQHDATRGRSAVMSLRTSRLGYRVRNAVARSWSASRSRPRWWTRASADHPPARWLLVRTDASATSSDAPAAVLRGSGRGVLRADDDRPMGGRAGDVHRRAVRGVRPRRLGGRPRRPGARRAVRTGIHGHLDRDRAAADVRARHGCRPIAVDIWVVATLVVPVVAIGLAYIVWRPRSIDGVHE